MPAEPPVLILHNPRCSKSRATLELLEARGVHAQVVHYLVDPPPIGQIESILDRLGIEPRELMRHDEAEYAELGLDDPTLTRAELVAAMHAHPRLIQRPIVLANGRAAIGRPPEAVLDIL